MPDVPKSRTRRVSCFVFIGSEERNSSKQEEGYRSNLLKAKGKNGAPGETRTPDLLVRSQTL